MAITLVNEHSPIGSKTLDGSETVIDVDWPLPSSDDLIVTFNDGAGPIYAYSLGNVGQSDGFTITFSTAPPANTKVTYQRSTKIERQVDYGQNKQFTAAAVNAEMAEKTLIALELRSLLNRTVRLPASDPEAALELPASSARANKFFYFDEFGNPSAVANTSDYTLEFAEYPVATPADADEFLFRRASDGLHRRVSKSALAAELEKNAPYHTPASVGIAVDGVTDVSYTLQQFFEANTSGGFFQGDPSKPLFLKNRLNIPSRWTVSGCAFVCAKGAGVRIGGDVATTPTSNLYRLLSNATAGTNTIVVDTSPQGGGLLSTAFPVGTRIVIRGKSDGAGNSIERDELVVTAVNDSTNTLTLSANLTYSYQITYTAGDYEANFGVVDRTYIVKIVSAALSADTAIGDHAVTCSASEVGQLTVGDFVLLEDDALTTSSNRLNTEPWMIVDITSTTVRLNGEIQHVMTTANRARLTKVNPAIRSSVQGCSIVYNEAADASPADRVHAFEISLGLDCSMVDCEVPNTASYAQRGNAFRIYRSHNCHTYWCQTRNNPHTGSGDGYGCTIYYSTKCSHVEPSVGGLRHECLFQGATHSRFVRPIVTDPRLAPFDWHGCGEAHCYVIDALIGGCDPSRFISTTMTAFKAGNTTHIGSARDCGVLGFQVFNVVGDASTKYAYVLRCDPGVDGFVLKSGIAKGCERLLKHAENAASPTTKTKKVRIEDVTAIDCTNWAIDIEGGTNKTMDSLTLRNVVFKGGPRVWSIVDANVVEFENVDVIDPAQTGSYYFLDATRVTDLRLRKCHAKGSVKGIKLTTCPHFKWLESSLTHANRLSTAQLSVSGAADNGSGLIRVTTSAAHNLVTGDTVVIASVGGTTEANANWTVTVVDSTNIDLQGSTFANAYTSGGTVDLTAEVFYDGGGNSGGLGDVVCHGFKPVKAGSGSTIVWGSGNQVT